MQEKQCAYMHIFKQYKNHTNMLRFFYSQNSSNFMNCIFYSFQKFQNLLPLYRNQIKKYVIHSPQPTTANNRHQTTCRLNRTLGKMKGFLLLVYRLLCHQVPHCLDIKNSKLQQKQTIS